MLRPTMLRYVALACCDQFAGASEVFFRPFSKTLSVTRQLTLSLIGNIFLPLLSKRHFERLLQETLEYRIQISLKILKYIGQQQKIGVS